jgi:RNA polymerase sigma-70 factor (ECF subfamily)
VVVLPTIAPVASAWWRVILPVEMDARDAAAIQAVLAGDVERFAELVDRHQAAALRVAVSLLGNYEEARDACQEAFVSAYRALARFRGGAAFSTWLYRIVVNECRDVLRRRARQPAVAALGNGAEEAAADGALVFDLEDPGAGPVALAANRELAQRLGGAMARLPQQQRTAFVLHHVHGLTLAEAAAVMRCRVGTVKAHVFRATQHLHELLHPWLTEEDR